MNRTPARLTGKIPEKVWSNIIHDLSNLRMSVSVQFALFHILQLLNLHLEDNTDIKFQSADHRYCCKKLVIVASIVSGKLFDFVFYP